jgi:Tfp pilus assembly PilM family ATPase
MAHPICGIDVGAYSIKFVVFEVGFRQSVFRGAFEELVGEGHPGVGVGGGAAASAAAAAAGAESVEPLLIRQARAVREGLQRVSSDSTLYLAVPGDQLSLRSLELPFVDPRKIDQVIGFELEGQMVHSLDDVIFDHVVVRRGDGGSTVVAAAARQEDVSALLEALRNEGIDPRALFAAPIIYHALGIAPEGADGTARSDGASLEVDGPDQPDEPDEPTQTNLPAIVDLGHLRTNLFVGQDGGRMFARTITRGGHHLTEALASALGVDRDRAERIKRTDARLLVPGVAADRRAGAPGPVLAPTAGAVKLDAILRGALAPLIRDLRQTLASVRATGGTDISRLQVTGGAARLKGMLPFLEQELGIPVTYLMVPNVMQGGAPLDTSAVLASLRSAEAQLDRDGAVAFEQDIDLAMTMRLPRAASESTPFALATAIALGASRGEREIDLRRGPFVYRANFSVLRQKALHLGVLGAALLAVVGLDVYASLSNLGAERKQLDAQLKVATQEVFGQSRTDAKEVALAMRKGFREELAPVPRATAFDLFEQISKRVPAADRIKLDIAEIDIRPKKTFIKGTVDSATAVDEIAERLKEIDCYEEVTKGAVTEVSDESKQFTLNVTSRCP